MSERCMIDTVDSGAHYCVRMSAESATVALSKARSKGADFVEFTLAQRSADKVWIDPNKVIAVVERA